MKQNLTILASTYPRWQDDTVPSFVQDFSDAIAPSFDKVTVIAPHYQGASKYERRGKNTYIKRFVYLRPHKHQNIVYDKHAATNVRKNPVYAIKLAAYVISGFAATFRISRKNPGVINAHWIIPQGWIAVVVGKLTKSPVVVTVHGSDVFTLTGKIMTSFKRWTLKHADGVVVNSSATLAACVDIFPNREYRLIPMGVNVGLFPGKKQPIRSSNVQNILFVGRLSPEKGIKYLIQAASELRNTGRKDFLLTVVGDGSQRPELERLVKKHTLLKHVVFAGWVRREDLQNYYQSADVFVGPSVEGEKGVKEALGLTFVEAALSEVPVIATNVGGIRDVVADGKTGFLVEQKSSKELCEKLAWLQDNQQAGVMMGKAARKLVKQKFSWKMVSRDYLKLFNELSVEQALTPAENGTKR